MARYTESVCRLCRREGIKLYLKGDKCFSDKCALTKRAYAPGQHGQKRIKLSEYGLQLREKQKARRVYGVLEAQFSRYFEMADRQKGITGENLLILLERRMDNVVYRLGFGASRNDARQLVSHGHFTVNGQRVDVPSYLIKVGDVIEVREKSRASVKFKRLLGEDAVAVNVPKWLDHAKNTLEGKVVALPTREDIDFPVEEHLIVELYSK